MEMTVADIHPNIRALLEETMPSDANVIGISHETIQAMIDYCDVTGEPANEIISRYISDPGGTLAFLEAFTAQAEHGPS
jgi:hypothetical protein